MAKFGSVALLLESEMLYGTQNLELCKGFTAVPKLKNF
jgi:hypothetical protein